MRLTRLEVENFLRLRALNVEIDEDGSLVIISGRNSSGKTSALKAIECALSGKGAVPDRPVHGDEKSARIVAHLSPSAQFPDGLIVRRMIHADRRTTLEITVPDGGKLKSPQSILDELVGRISFDPLEFARMAPKDRAKVVAEIAGIDTETWASRRAVLYDARRDANRDVKRAEGVLAGMPAAPGAPKAEVSITALTQRLQAANASQRAAEAAERNVVGEQKRIEHQDMEIARLETALREARDYRTALEQSLTALSSILADARENAIDPKPISDAMASAEERNALWRKAQERERAKESLGEVQTSAKKAQEALDLFDAECAEQLAAASFPIEGLGLDENDVTFQGVPFTQASSSEQIRVGVAVGLALNPEVRTLLVREGSLLDDDALYEVAKYAHDHDAQLIVEQVNARPGTVIIEDGVQVEEVAS